MFDYFSESMLYPKLINIHNNLILAQFELMKLIPAYYIISKALKDNLINKEFPIVETSSGSFALGMGVVCSKLKIPFYIISDNVINDSLKQQLIKLGGTVKILPDILAGNRPQEIRIRELHQYLRENPNSFWPCQYDNLDNQKSYSAVADFFFEKIGDDFILVATVGSGGSACGIAKRLRAKRADLYLIGVDTFGSVLFGMPNQKRMLRGLGNSIMPKNLDHTCFDEVHWVIENDAFYFTRNLKIEKNLFCGATTGAAYQVAKWIAKREPDRKVVFIGADLGHRYWSTVYNPIWLYQHGWNIKPACSPIHIEQPYEIQNHWAFTLWIEEIMTRLLKVIMKRKFVFIESNTTGTGELLIYKAIELGYEVIFFTNKISKYKFLPILSLKIFIVDTTDRYLLLNRLKLIDKISAIYSTSEYYVEIATFLSVKLGLHCTSFESILICRNKFKLHAVLKLNKFNVPQTVKIDSTLDLLGLSHDLSFPVVVKPISGSGSLGVKLCQNRESSLFYIKYLLKNFKCSVLLQEYIRGDEYSVEVCSFGGEHHVLGVTKKYLTNFPFFIESGHDFPAILSDQQKYEIRQTVIFLLDKLKFSFGFSHVEIKIFEKKIFIIEVNPRLAGGMIPILIKESTGIDVLEKLIYLYTEGCVKLDISYQQFSAIRHFIIDKAGMITKIGAKNGIDENIKFNIKINDSFSPKGDFRDRLAYVLHSDKDIKVCLDQVNKKLENIFIEIE